MLDGLIEYNRVQKSIADVWQIVIVSCMSFGFRERLALKIKIKIQKPVRNIFVVYKIILLAILNKYQIRLHNVVQTFVHM